MTRALEDVIAERERQQWQEGWTREHDDQHSHGELAHAAGCYAHAAGEQADGTMPQPTDGLIPFLWPFHWRWWKPRDQRRNLVRAAALLLAAIEQFDRATNATEARHG